MLTNTFCHIPGVGEKTEQRTWASGLHCWGDALLAPRLPTGWKPHLEESMRQLAVRNAEFFSRRLPSNQQWRLYRDFQDSCAFVDIETTGMGPSATITTIALYDGKTIRNYIRGQNLEQFLRDILPYRLMVTYNGKSFDAPILERELGSRLPRAHVDLRYVLGGLGLKGGLKAVEQRVGLERVGLESVDGFTAVLLWQAYRAGNAQALETLLAYNTLDVLNLHWLIVYAHNEYLKRTPLGGQHALPGAVLPEVPFEPDTETVARVTRQRAGLLWGR